MFFTVAETASRLRRSVTIEPVVMLYLTAIGLNEVIRPNLLLDKACVQKLKYNRCGTGNFRELLLMLLSLSLSLLLLPLLTKKVLNVVSASTAVVLADAVVAAATAAVSAAAVSAAAVSASTAVVPAGAIVATTAVAAATTNEPLLKYLFFFKKVPFASTVCDDLSEKRWEDELEEVQTVVSDYERTLSLMAFAPRRVTMYLHHFLYKNQFYYFKLILGKLNLISDQICRSSRSLCRARRITTSREEGR